MAIQSIESGYAYCFGRDDITGSQMGVLIGLCFCQNGQTGRCNPSYGYLAKLTHYSRSAVERALRELRGHGLIDWSAANGVTSNRFRMRFPETPMKSFHERYVPVAEMMESTHVRVTCPPRQDDVPPTSQRCTPHVRVTYPPRQDDVPPTSGRRTNTEENTELNSVINSVVTAIRNRTKTDGKILFGSPGESLPVQAPRMTPLDSFVPLSPIQEAMNVCGVTDEGNYRVFSSEMLKHNPDDVRECIYTFKSEIAAGEHANAQNLAAVLMKRLQALP